ncbi:alpha/beta-hydrolase [Dendrothele bispora CBS 962.96]|uniref:Alpha/beta-hydrolase n=1 Tax=Dendrothele bispora (strain CBS 962.96) TaxID=1314807 RepID=A0A4V4HIE5_DENBC|nr:alpha/beta-hydrolase [Dendrothele bispora CBS 962.96]
MDPSSYRVTTVSRGFKYRYYFTQPRSPIKTFLFFVHGYPSTSYDWYRQVQFFQEKGYGLIVPDMLGYGGTSKPTDPASYNKDIARDLIDILDAENIKQAVFIGHDWGSWFVSRVLSLFSDRAQAAGFLALGYMPPSPNTHLASEETLKKLKELVGYEVFAYIKFFGGDEDSSKICMENLDAFWNILYPEDPKTWLTDMAPAGALKESLLSGKVLPQASWLSSEDRAHQMEAIRAGGLEAPMCYYRAHIRGIHMKGDQAIPLPNYTISQPVFYGAALEDYICLPLLSKPNMDKYCKNLTYKEFKANHWIMLQVPDEVNRELLAWVEGLEGLDLQQ